MTITVDDRPNALVHLLWVREAYDLRVRGDDLPPPLIDTPDRMDSSAVSPSTRADGEDAWPRVWRAAARHAGLDRGPALFDRLHRTANGSAQRAEFLRQVIGPTWHDEFGDDEVADAAFREWNSRGAEAHRASMSRRLEEQPERRDLDAVIPAWRAGLTKIVTIPCRGEFVRTITANALLMTDVTRERSASYRRALAEFAGGG